MIATAIAIGLLAGSTTAVTAQGEGTTTTDDVIDPCTRPASTSASSAISLTSSREPAAPVVGSIYPTDIASCESTAVE